MKPWFLFSLTLFTIQPASAFLASRHWDAALAEDRQNYVEEMQREFRHCTEGYDSIFISCGRKGSAVGKDIGDGNPEFHNEFYQKRVPKGPIKRADGVSMPQHVIVETKCDERDGRFYTTIMHLDQKGCYTGFQSPLTDNTMALTQARFDGSQGCGARTVPIQRCLTSPGEYFYTGNGHQTPDRWRTDLPAESRGSAYLAQWHVVSDAALDRWGWEDDCRENEKVTINGQRRCPTPIMPWAVNVRGNIFYHASNEVTGHPASKGCLRLSDNCAQGLYELVNHVGSEHVTFKWNGYGRTNPRTGHPFCAGPEAGSPNPTLAVDTRVKQFEGTPQQIQQRSSNIWGRFLNFFRANPHQRQQTPRGQDTSA